MENKSGVAGKILIGHLIISLPSLIFLCGLSLIAVYLTGNSTIFYIALLVGLIGGWVWFSFMTPRWRAWAIKQGADPVQLQKWAVVTGLTWAKGPARDNAGVQKKDEDNS